MNLIEGIRVALRGLAANKLRSALTMLGIVIGVAAVVALLAIGQGAQASITSRIQSIGTNVIFVTPGQRSRGGVSSTANAAPLTLEDSQAIADIVPDIAAIAPVYSRNQQVVYQDKNTNTNIIGTTPQYTEVSNSYLDMGVFVTDEDVRLASNVAVLGPEVATNLFGNAQAALGQSIKINRVSFRVVGIMESKGGSGPGGNNDTLIYIPISTAYRYFGGRAATGASRVVSTINVSVVSEDKVDAVSDDITWLLRRRHNIRNDQDDFSVLKQQDFLDLSNQVTGILTVFLGAIAGISLLVGGIGIMNIMLVSVTERTREIGIRKAVGACQRDILTQFLVEAVVISLLGGLLGIAVGVGVAQLVTLIGLFTAVVSPGSIVLAAGFSVAVGLFFGIWPAQRAAALRPIDALRYE